MPNYANKRSLHELSYTEIVKILYKKSKTLFQNIFLSKVQVVRFIKVKNVTNLVTLPLLNNFYWQFEFVLQYSIVSFCRLAHQFVYPYFLLFLLQYSLVNFLVTLLQFTRSLCYIYFSIVPTEIFFSKRVPRFCSLSYRTTHY